ncbi:L-histidine N(alpha)-methyltransferase [Echinicola marina]|uniref:L-histidine N(alpha)-methyltransferase n=1 Tax=Echinicola marina TaxID=2859768 RepID=UPI001CF698E8|nr:L-histidine N(alpha)-methyltransferase [Echinicola marina]UCS92949.1 L-histidine N(alpha)-methyltransferase [Echinicola marina]
MEFILKEKGEFALDVQSGLSAPNKYLLSKYFYDHRGDELFQKIMQLPEYYLTRTEFSILHHNYASILAPILEMQHEFNLVELGAGDGFKTKILIEYLESEKAAYTYYPIDISGNVLAHLKQSLRDKFERIQVHPIQDIYRNALAGQLWDHKRRTLLLFLGANIGNFVLEEAKEILKLMAATLGSGDFALIGFDLKKDPELILGAYDDSQGVTRDFNLNILTRINKELGGDFDLSKFKHWPVYNPVNGECRSYLVSLADQEVRVDALAATFHFKRAEAIHTEVSKKYDKEELNQLAEECGFEIIHNFQDDHEFFTDSLWKKR